MLTVSMSCWICQSIGGQRQSAREEQVKQPCYDGGGDTDRMDVLVDQSVCPLVDNVRVLDRTKSNNTAARDNRDADIVFVLVDLSVRATCGGGGGGGGGDGGGDDDDGNSDGDDDDDDDVCDDGDDDGEDDDDVCM